MKKKRKEREKWAKVNWRSSFSHQKEKFENKKKMAKIWVEQKYGSH